MVDAVQVERLVLETVAAPTLATVFASGDLDAETASQLRAGVRDAAGGAGVRRVVVDAAAVRFVDSSGLGALVASRAECERAGIELVVRRPADRLVRLLRRTGLDRILVVDAV